MDEIEAMLHGRLQAGSRVLTELDTKRVLQAAGIPTTPCQEASDDAEAVLQAERLGYPVVLKVSSPRILHKSEIGGVKIGLQDAAAVREAYHDIVALAHAVDVGASVTVQPMAKPGVEVIIGMTTDPHFGPVIMFGLGGILAELLQDVCFRLIPIDRSTALGMVMAVRGAPLLTGYRGAPVKDLAALADIVWHVSDLASRYRVLAQIDLNPVIVYEKGAVVVDAWACLASHLRKENLAVSSTVDDLVCQFVARLRRAPLFYFDLLHDFPDANYRAIMQAWGRIREKYTLSRDDVGRYYLPRNGD